MVYFSSILWSLPNFQFFTYIFVYFQVLYIFHIFRFYYIFYIVKLSYRLSVPRQCFIYRFVLRSWQMCFSYQWCWRIKDFSSEVSTRMDEYFTTSYFWNCNTFCALKWSFKVDATCKMVTLWSGVYSTLSNFLESKTRSRISPWARVEYCEYWWKQKCWVKGCIYLNFLVASDPN